MIQICMWIQQMILAAENPFKSKDSFKHVSEQLEKGNNATEKMTSDERFEQEIFGLVDRGYFKGLLAFKIEEAKRLILNSSISESERADYNEMISDVEQQYINCSERDTNTRCDIKNGIADIDGILNDFKLLLEKKQSLNGMKRQNK